MPRTSWQNDDDLPEFEMPQFRSEAEEVAWWDRNADRLTEEAIAQLRSRQKLGNARRHRVQLREDVHLQLQSVAERRRMTLDEVVNDLLVKDLALAEAVKPGRRRRRPTTVVQ